MRRYAKKEGPRHIVLALALFATVSCSSRPSHFVCDGTRWAVDEAPHDVRNISATLELVPDINRLIFGTQHYGLLKVDSHRFLFEVARRSSEKLYFSQGGEAAPTEGGYFDLINGEMYFAVRDGIYHLQCRSATPLNG